MPIKAQQPEPKTPAQAASSLGTSTLPKGLSTIFPTLIELTEGQDKIILDIQDKNGGLGLKVYLDYAVASRLGIRMADRARFAVAKASNDPLRSAVDQFSPPTKTHNPNV